MAGMFIYSENILPTSHENIENILPTSHENIGPYFFLRIYVSVRCSVHTGQ